MERKFTKLSDLVGETFKVEKAYGYKFKKWDSESGRMLVSDTYEKDYRKIYSVETDKGLLDLGAGQLGNLLEGVYRNGVADITGRTFQVRSNGKTGMDIRYYLNPVSNETEEVPLDY